MPPMLSLAYELPATPAELLALLQDRDFVEQRLGVLQVTAAELVRHEVGDQSLTTTTMTTFPRSIVPRIARGFVLGAPRFRRTETWGPVDDGYDGHVDVDLIGTPSTIAGRMCLRPGPAGSRLTFDCTISIPLL